MRMFALLLSFRSPRTSWSLTAWRAGGQFFFGELLGCVSGPPQLVSDLIDTLCQQLRYPVCASITLRCILVTALNAQKSRATLGPAHRPEWSRSIFHTLDRSLVCLLACIYLMCWDWDLPQCKPQARSRRFRHQAGRYRPKTTGGLVCTAVFGYVERFCKSFQKSFFSVSLAQEFCPTYEEKKRIEQFGFSICSIIYL